MAAQRSAPNLAARDTAADTARRSRRSPARLRTLGPSCPGSPPWVQGGRCSPLSLPVSLPRFASLCSWTTAPAYRTLSAWARHSGSFSAISHRPGECRGFWRCPPRWSWCEHRPEMRSCCSSAVPSRCWSPATHLSIWLPWLAAGLPSLRPVRARESPRGRGDVGAGPLG